MFDHLFSSLLFSSHSLMETSGLLFLFFFSSSFFTHKTLSENTNCEPSSCEPYGPQIRFPFRLIDRQDERCGYPGFDLYCNNQSQTILNLRYSGEFIVDAIDYTHQYIYLNDPGYCLPKRVQKFTVAGSSFAAAHSGKFTFLNCSSPEESGYMPYWFAPLYCRDSSNNYTVVAIAAGYYVPPTCRNISTVSVPVQWSTYDQYTGPMNLAGDLQLTWRAPDCGECEADGGTCGFKGDSADEIECFNRPKRANTGLPRSAKYGIIIGIGIPALVCLIGLACFSCSRLRTYGRRRQLDPELSVRPITPHRSIVTAGLDGPTIESYPKTVLGESRRLPKLSDGTCPICLAEYEPKETLRTIPECNHYFHASCIDEWLRMNATCPLCRNSPSGSSLSLSSLTSSSSTATS